MSSSSLLGRRSGQPNDRRREYGGGNRRGENRKGGNREDAAYSEDDAKRRRRNEIQNSWYDNEDEDEDQYGDQYELERHSAMPQVDYGNSDDPFGDYEDVGFDYEDHERSGGDNNPNPAKQSQEQQGDEALRPSHFFSRKPLSDPAFAAQKDNGNRVIFDKLCKGAGITRASKIQSLAWPVLLGGSSAIVADQTGSGKTLAYLLPLLQRALGSAPPEQKSNGAPRILILAPTGELADQIYDVCTNKLSSFVKFHTMVITAAGSRAMNIRDQIRRLQNHHVDVLISTPGRIATILRSKNSGGLDLTSLQALVLDEVDVLLIDETFGPQLRTVGVAAPVESTQFVFVTATLPDEVVEKVEREFPNVQKVRGPGLHRVALTVKEHLVDVSVPSIHNRDSSMCFDVKAKQLMKSLRQTKCQRTLIFCNTVESCRSVENLLKRSDRKGLVYRVSAYHNAMASEARNRNFATFCKAKGRDQIMVCTDRAGRGIDFGAAPVDHVILFDFPKDPAEYVRRVGRTARAGRIGTSTVFAYGWQLPIARKIMGSKLESFSIAMDTLEERDEEEDEYTVQGRKNRRRQKKNDTIKGNIEGGRLWK